MLVKMDVRSLRVSNKTSGVCHVCRWCLSLCFFQPPPKKPCDTFNWNSKASSCQILCLAPPPFSANGGLRSVMGWRQLSGVMLNNGALSDLLMYRLLQARTSNCLRGGRKNTRPLITLLDWRHERTLSIRFGKCQDCVACDGGRSFKSINNAQSRFTDPVWWWGQLTDLLGKHLEDVTPTVLCQVVNWVSLDELNNVTTSSWSPPAAAAADYTVFFLSALSSCPAVMDGQIPD